VSGENVIVVKVSSQKNYNSSKFWANPSP